MRQLTALAMAVVGMLSASRANAQMSASDIYRKVSNSIVTVHARDEDGKEISQGSGVVIGRGVVASNCHVVENAESAVIKSGGKALSGKLLHWDSDIDLCSFQVAGLTAAPVDFGKARGLQVGDEVFAIGAPQGFDLTLSNGIVSGLRPLDGEFVIQTTAAISPGSSGGGLFDATGRLVGITTMYLKDSQQMNFAVPTEWVVALPARSARLRRDEAAKTSVQVQVAAWEQAIETADPVGFAQRKDRLYAVAKVLIGSVKESELLQSLKSAYRLIVEEDEAKQAAADAAAAAADAAEAAADAAEAAPKSRWFALTGTDDEDVALDIKSFTSGGSPEVWVRFTGKPGTASAKNGITQTMVRIKTFCASREYTTVGSIVYRSDGSSTSSGPDYGRKLIAPNTVGEEIHSVVCD